MQEHIKQVHPVQGSVQRWAAEQVHAHWSAMNETQPTWQSVSSVWLYKSLHCPPSILHLAPITTKKKVVIQHYLNLSALVNNFSFVNKISLKMPLAYEHWLMYRHPICTSRWHEYKWPMFATTKALRAEKDGNRVSSWCHKRSFPFNHVGSN